MLTPNAQKVHEAILVACGAGCAKGTRDMFRPEESDNVDDFLNEVGDWIKSSRRRGYPGSRGALAEVIADRLSGLLNDRSEAALHKLKNALLAIAWE